MKKLSRVFITAVLVGILMLCSSLMVFADTTTDGGVIGTSNLNGSAQNSAKVGDKLIAPEIGWKRYDDRNSLLIFNGTGWQTNTDSLCYNSTYRQTNVLTDKMVFKFYGTKLRLIGLMSNNTQYCVSARVKIDGLDCGTFTERGTDVVYQRLHFEKTDLSLGEHSVEISFNDSYLEMDAIDIDDTGYLVDPNKPTSLAARLENKVVNLTWNAVDRAVSYNVKRSTTAGGQYTTIAPNVTGTSFTDSNIASGTTYYYVVTAVTSSGESSNSNEASTTFIVSNSAILEVTMTNGAIKEYDMTGTELDSFLTWYDDRSNGTGKSYFTITKKNNIKPFLSRKEYLPFDKILNFEVKEYNDN